MSDLWWQMPGPKRYIDRVVRALQDGKIAVPRLPEHITERLDVAVKDALRGNSREWVRLSVEEQQAQEPAPWLYARVLNSSPPSPCSARTLCSDERFDQKIIWLDKLERLTQEGWRSWKEFFASYQHTLRSQNQDRRTSFCAPLIGERANDPPKEDICLSHHRWLGIIEPLDMMLFTATLFHEAPMSRFEKSIAISTVTHLAAFDPAVSDRLASEPLRTALSPTAIFQEMATDRGWQRCDLESCQQGNGDRPYDQLWAKGMINRLDRRDEIHSALLTFNANDRQIQQRKRLAQINVIFPIIEEQRQRLAAEMKDPLIVPFLVPFDNGDFGEIKLVEDLEISHLASRIKKAARKRDDLARQACDWFENYPHKSLALLLAEIRHKLSHDIPIEPDLLVSEELRDIWGND